MILVGESRMGKTRTALAFIWREALKKPYFKREICFCSILDLVRDMEGREWDERFHRYNNAHLLVIDDIHAATFRPKSAERFFELIRNRHDQCQPTIMTCTGQTDEILRWWTGEDERLLRFLTPALNRIIEGRRIIRFGEEREAEVREDMLPAGGSVQLG